LLKKLADLFSQISAYFFPPGEKVIPQQQEDYFTLVEQARREWLNAKEKFDQIGDPDLIDHAVYNLDAAERRYIYLLKKAKEEGANIYTAVDERGN